MKRKQKFIHKKENSGFVVIIATIIASIILVIGSGVIGISVRDLKLARLQERSMLAFYAADTGLDCALDLDFGPMLNPPCTNIATPMSPYFPGSVLCPIPTQATCLGGTINRAKTFIGNPGTYPWGYETILTANSDGYIKLDNNSCFQVTVTKRAVEDNGSIQESTKIVSKGSSNCVNGGVDSGIAERELILEW